MILMGDPQSFTVIRVFQHLETSTQALPPPNPQRLATHLSKSDILLAIYNYNYLLLHLNTLGTRGSYNHIIIIIIIITIIAN